MHDALVPPTDVTGDDLKVVDWKMEFDVTVTFLAEHGARGTLHRRRRQAARAARGGRRVASPHIILNMMEDFLQHPGVRREFRRLPGAAAGALHRLQSARPAAGRDKALSKKLLAYHGFRSPSFNVFGQRPRRAPAEAASSTR
jgi:hypothetical protein